MNVVVDVADPDNRVIAMQLGIKLDPSSLPRVRGIELQVTNQRNQRDDISVD